mgnify:CR=1 FL=1
MSTFNTFNTFIACEPKKKKTRTTKTRTTKTFSDNYPTRVDDDDDEPIEMELFPLEKFTDEEIENLWAETVDVEKEREHGRWKASGWDFTDQVQEIGYLCQRFQGNTDQKRLILKQLQKREYWLLLIQEGKRGMSVAPRFLKKYPTAFDNTNMLLRELMTPRRKPRRKKLPAKKKPPRTVPLTSGERIRMVTFISNKYENEEARFIGTKEEIKQTILGLRKQSDDAIRKTYNRLVSRYPPTPEESTCSVM